jgi:hypothetical protein
VPYHQHLPPLASRPGLPRIDRDPDVVWTTVSDAGSIADWFPLIAHSEATGNRREIKLQDGSHVEEAIVTSDDALRRFQYKIVGGDIPVEHHLGTIDVIGVGGQSLVVYSTDVTPDALADVIGPALNDAVSALSAHLSRPETVTTNGGDPK